MQVCFYSAKCFSFICWLHLVKCLWPSPNCRKNSRQSARLKGCNGVADMCASKKQYCGDILI